MLMPMLIAAEVIITGTVSDSITGAPIFGATVVVTPPACSTLTNSLGKYSLAIVTTEINSHFLPKTGVKILYNPAGNVFSWNGMDNFSIKVRSLNGEVVKGDKLPLGQYFAVWHGAKKSGVFKFLNISGQSQSFFIEGNEIDNSALSKTEASSYVVNFKAANYTPASRTISGTSNLDLRLLPVAILNDSSKANIKINVGPIDTLKVNSTFSN
jgi:hypothetical protein